MAARTRDLASPSATGSSSASSFPSLDPCRARWTFCGSCARSAYVVGDAVWDLLATGRAWILGVGQLSGGYGEEELARAGAFRVYRDPADLQQSLDEIGALPRAGVVPYPFELPPWEQAAGLVD